MPSGSGIVQSTGSFDVLGSISNSTSLSVGTTSTFGGNITGNGYLTLTGQATPQIFMASNTAGTPSWTMIARNDGYFLIGRSGVSNDFYLDTSGDATFAGSVGVAGKTPAYGLTLAQGTGSGSKIAWTDGSPDFAASIYASSSTDKLTFATKNASNVETTALEIDTSQNSTFAGDITLGGNILLNGGVLYKNSGSIEIKAENIRIKGVTTNENLAGFNENGSVQLFYDNVEKFATTSTGVSVTGSSSRFTVDSASASAIDIGYYSSVRTIRALETGGNNLRPLAILSQNFNVDSSGNATFAGNVNVGTGLAGTVNVGLTDDYKGVIEYLAAALKRT